MNDLVPEHVLRDVVDLLVRLVEFAGALVIFAGAVVAFGRFLSMVVRGRGAASFVPIRLDLGRFLGLGLELQLAADVLRTAIAPTFKEIGQLAAVAAIRTALNFFLRSETRQERSEVGKGEAEGVDGGDR